MKASDVSINILSDGLFKVDGGLVFGQVPKVLWQRLTPADHQNRIRLGLNSLLVRIGGLNVLIDTGVGTKATQKTQQLYGLGSSKLAKGLRACGLSAKDINIVILSHLHFDHVGGCTRLDRSGNVVLTYPKATYFVQRSAWDAAIQPNERAAASHHPEDFVPIHERGQLTLLDGDTEVCPGIWAKVTNGHTPGHQVVLFNNGGERVIFLGDLIPTPFHIKLPYIAAFDHSPEDTLALKRDLLDRAEKEGWLLVFSHGYQERAGYVERRNGKRLLRAVDL